MGRITVLHENRAWLPPLAAALDGRGLPWDEWFLDRGTVPFHRAPPKGLFYNRMSASAHSRGHRYAPELAHGALNWLEAHGRRVVNSSRALYLEVSKLAQYAALARAGIPTPRTAAAVGREGALAAARGFGTFPLILKPNRGGKGLGVRLVQDIDSLAEFLDGPGAAEAAPVDGLWLVQDYVRPADGTVTRCEFVGGRFLYALRVDTSAGFELCPADACETEGGACPAEASDGAPDGSRFEVVPGFAHGLLERYRRFLAENGIEIAGIEFIQDASGEIFTYDVNTNTNYNGAAEAAAGVAETGMQAIARFLGDELEKLEGRERERPTLAAAE